MLVFQAILPFLVFAGDDTGSPITLKIQGGTNVSISMSVDFLQQVQIPTLETIGLSVKCEVLQRGWSFGVP